MLAAKIRPVTMLPNSGLPEDSSKTEPTAAIALMQHNSKHTPLFGVIEII
jgi:urease accessory protein UreF